MNLPERDLDEIVEFSGSDMRVFEGAHVFITGGSGFVGSWLLESIAWANASISTGITVTALVRDIGRFVATFPRLASAPGFRFVQGDVANPPSGLGRFDVIVHAATQPADGEIAKREPDRVFNVALEGMRFALSLSALSGGIPVLFTSSGAVYGRQPRNLPALTEDYSGAPNTLESSNAYNEGKRACEMLCAIAHSQKLAQPKIARLFAFLGPRLPHDRQFAAGNFVADALAARPIVVNSDGSAVRSYLYPTDMITSLWAVLARGAPARAYNVGSGQAVRISELAAAISRSVNPPVQVHIEQRAEPEAPVNRYVPNVDRIRDELGVAERIPLHVAIERTIAFYRREK